MPVTLSRRLSRSPEKPGPDPERSGTPLPHLSPNTRPRLARRSPQRRAPLEYRSGRPHHGEERRSLVGIRLVQDVREVGEERAEQSLPMSGKTSPSDERPTPGACGRRQVGTPAHPGPSPGHRYRPGRQGLPRGHHRRDERGSQPATRQLVGLAAMASAVDRAIGLSPTEQDEDVGRHGSDRAISLLLLPAHGPRPSRPDRLGPAATSPSPCRRESAAWSPTRCRVPVSSDNRPNASRSGRMPFRGTRLRAQKEIPPAPPQAKVVGLIVLHRDPYVSTRGYNPDEARREASRLQQIGQSPTGDQETGGPAVGEPVQEGLGRRPDRAVVDSPRGLVEHRHHGPIETMGH